MPIATWSRASTSSNPTSTRQTGSAARHREETVAKYDQDPEPLVQLRAKLRTEIGKLFAARRLPKSRRRGLAAVPTAAGRRNARATAEEREAQFQRFREAFAAENALETFSQQWPRRWRHLKQRGLLAATAARARRQLGEDLVRSNPEVAALPPRRGRDVADVLITDEAAAKLQQSLNEKLASRRSPARVRVAAAAAACTLTLNIAGHAEGSRRGRRRGARTPFIPREKDVYVIAKAGETINPERCDSCDWSTTPSSPSARSTERTSPVRPPCWACSSPSTRCAGSTSIPRSRAHRRAAATGRAARIVRASRVAGHDRELVRLGRRQSFRCCCSP